MLDVVGQAKKPEQDLPEYTFMQLFSKGLCSSTCGNQMQRFSFSILTEVYCYFCRHCVFTNSLSFFLLSIGSNDSISAHLHRSGS